MKSLDKLKEKLRSEGYSEIYEWKDAPNQKYSSHKHDTDNVLYILEGDIVVTIGSKIKKYVAGERVDIKANEVHSAKAGSKGCTYLVGECRN